MIYTATTCSDYKYICCNGYKKTECYVDEQGLTDEYCDWQFDEYENLACTDDVFTCPTDNTTMRDSIPRNDCCKFMEDECCRVECEEDGYHEGWLYTNDDGEKTCKYKQWYDDGTFEYITPCQC